ncbi:cell wall-active antibiotics response protein LiaF [Camelliibacillus cellulosilyticus]|uniref:Cell wall-active antibiotics response protein LiaF n=1 Tax=Camelliibacillus cellulosilyticus TaxID=2174486 RepID=A0ABV9GNZ8_9BACL
MPILKTIRPCPLDYSKIDAKQLGGALERRETVRSSNGIIGLIFVILGIVVLMTLIGWGMMFIGPIILVVLGMVFLRKNKRLIGGLLVLIGILVFFNILFHTDAGVLIVAVIFLYIGYRLIRDKRHHGADSSRPYTKKRHRRHRDEKYREADPKNEPESDDWIDAEIEKLKQKKGESYERKTDDTAGPETVSSGMVKSSLFGDLHLMHHRFELEDMNVWHGIGDVKIDLSKAIIHEGETVLVINGWLGDIDIYVPYDLDVSVNATVTFGDLDILNQKQGGIQRHISVATKDYRTSTRRVKIILSLFIGDIDVRFL